MLTQAANSQSTQSNREEIFTAEMRKRRANVVEELMRSERDYVRLLEDIVQGFLEQTRRRTDLFTSQVHTGKLGIEVRSRNYLRIENSGLLFAVFLPSFDIHW